MAGLIEYTGMNQRPMFINWTPYNLDLTPYRQNQQMMLSMSADLAKQAQAVRQKAIDLEIPDLPGISTSVTLAQQKMIEGKQKAIELSSIGNPNMLPQNPEWRKAIQAATILPDTKRKLEQELEDARVFQGQVKAIDGGAGLVLADERGFPIPDPHIKGEFLRAGDAYSRKMTHPAYSDMNPESVSPDLRSSILGDSNAYRKELYEGFRQSGSNEASSSWKNDYATLSEVASGSSGNSQDQLMAAITLNARSETNRPQIEAGIRAELRSLNAGKRAAMFSDFVNTDTYMERASRPISKGGYLKPDGSIDPEAAMNSMLSDPTETPAFRMSRKGEREERISFGANYVLHEAARAASDSNLIDPKLMQVHGGAGSAENVGTAQFYNDLAMFGQFEKTVGGVRVPGAEPVPIKMPVTDPRFGTTKALSLIAERVPVPESVQKEHKRNIGLTDSNGELLAVEKRPKLAQAYPGATGMFLGGGTFKTDDLDAILLDEEAEMVMLPVVDPATGMPLKSYGANTMEPYLKVKFAISDATMNSDNAPTDFIEQISMQRSNVPWDEDPQHASEMNLVRRKLNDDDYLDAHPEVGDSNIEDIYDDEFESGWGNDATIVTGYVKMPFSMRADKKKEYQYNRQARIDMVNTDAENQRLNELEEGSYQKALGFSGTSSAPKQDQSYQQTLQRLLSPTP